MKKSKRGLMFWKGKKPFKLRSEYLGQKGNWFQPFFASPKQIREIVKGTKWSVKTIYKNKAGDRYSGVLEKK
jgi:hypothetical protein